MFSKNIKKIALTGLLLFGSLNAIDTSVIYKVFDKLGSITDPILTRGELSEKHKQMFEETAKKLGIDHRDIKARNSGLIMRLFFGYNNAMAYPQTNRVYINEDCLNEIDDNSKQFLMAHELDHHLNHDIFSKIVINNIAFPRVEDAIVKSCAIKGFIDGENDNFAKQYMTYGINYHPYWMLLPKLGISNEIIIKIIQFLLPLPGINLSFLELLKGKINQSFETRADTQAVTIAGVNPDGGVKLMRYLHHPDTKNWPLYAKIKQFCIEKFVLPVISLPLFKEHVDHLVSLEDRIAHIKSLKPQWEKMQEEKQKSA